MTTKFHTIRLGTCNSYLIEGQDGYLLIDAGNSNKEEKFIRLLKKIGISPASIKLIVVTHVHFDHVGSLNEIKKLCNCPVAVHERETALLKSGKVVIPPGTNPVGKSLSWLGNKLPRGLFKFSPVDPEIIISREFLLDDYGFSGRIIPTPGHTEGSISVLFYDGLAFVGDLTINYLPFNLGPVFPPFAGNTKELLVSWKKILNEGVKFILPGHGTGFDVNMLSKKYSKLELSM